jgi:Flp pilus assembly protein TadD
MQPLRRRFNAGLLATFAALTSLAAPARGQTAAEFQERGHSSMVRGDFDKAIADFSEAIRLDPKEANAYVGRGNAWAAKGDKDKADADYRQAKRLKRAS